MCKDFGMAFSELAHGKTPVQEAEDTDAELAGVCLTCEMNFTHTQSDAK